MRSAVSPIRIAPLLVLAAIVTTAAYAATPTAEAVVARDVVDRQPVDTSDSFPAGIGQIVCWTRISGAEAGDRIEHVWLHEDREIDRVTLEVGGPGWRTWSRKSIPATWTGDWRVDVIGPDGAVLATVPFRLE